MCLTPTRAKTIFKINMKSKTTLFTLVIHVPGMVLNDLQVQPNKKMFVFQENRSNKPARLAYPGQK